MIKYFDDEGNEVEAQNATNAADIQTDKDGKVISSKLYIAEKEQEEAEKGPGPGWWGPPKGTHGAGDDQDSEQIATDTKLEYAGRLTEEVVEERTGLSSADYSKMFHVPGHTTRISFRTGHDVSLVVVEVNWRKDGQVIGSAQRLFDGKMCHNDVFKLHDKGKGLGRQLYKQQIDVLTKAGYEKIRLQANITIGRYAWAKMGFDYKPSENLSSRDHARLASEKFQRWVTSMGFEEPGKGWPMFETARDVATYTISGTTVTGDGILNKDVPVSMELSLGKAFMLDQSDRGHGSWNGVLKLG